MDQFDEAADLRMAAALDYIRKGLAVVPLHSATWSEGGWRCTCGVWPCKSTGKHPRPGYGKDHAVTSEEKVRDAWGKWPDTNVAVVVPPGFMVADLDGPEAREWWLGQPGGAVATRVCLSGSGLGQHRWYRLPEGVSFRGKPQPVKIPGSHQQVMVIAPEHGYVVMPPSRHASGGEYRWENGVRQSAVVPLDFMNRVTTSATRNGTTEADSPGGWLEQATGKVTGSGRQSLMLSYLGALHQVGVTEETLLGAAHEMNQRFDDQLDIEDTEDLVRRTLGYPGGQKLRNLGLAARLTSDDGGSTSTPAERRGEWGEGPFKLQVERSDPKVWLLHFPDGIVRVSSAGVMSWERIQTAHLEQLERSPRWMPSSGGRNEGWRGDGGRFDRLERQMTPEDHLEPPPELTLAGQVRELLVRFAGSDPGEVAERSDASLDQGNVWWAHERGRLYFKFRALCLRHSRSATPGERMSAAEIRVGLQALGGEASTVEWIDGKARRLGWVPLGSLEGA